MDIITQDAQKYGIRKFFHTMYEKSMEAYKTLSEAEKSKLYDDGFDSGSGISIISGISFYSDSKNHVHIQDAQGYYDLKTDVNFDFMGIWLTVTISKDFIGFWCSDYRSKSNPRYSFYFDVFSELKDLFGDFLKNDPDTGDDIYFTVSKNWF